MPAPDTKAAAGWRDPFVDARRLDYDLGDAGRFDDLGANFSGRSIGARRLS